MEQLNRIELRGVVGFVRRQLIQDKTVYHFTLATSRAFKDKSGQAVIDTVWHQVEAWEGPNIESPEKIEKGSKLYVCGRVRNQRYTGGDNIDRSYMEVVAQRLVFVDPYENLNYEL
ncbi:MAG: single-stranded DNA-binding protein [Candidatus Cryptobacteroides sp.]